MKGGSAQQKVLSYLDFWPESTGEQFYSASAITTMSKTAGTRPNLLCSLSQQFNQHYGVHSKPRFQDLRRHDAL